MFNNSTTDFTMPVTPIGYANYGGANCGWGENGWIWLIVLLALFGGWGNNGFGGNFGFGSKGCGTCATQADVRSAVDQQTLISKLDQQTYGLADSTYAINNSIQNGFFGVQNALCQGFNGVNTGMLTGFNGLQSQIADCCCTTQRAIDGINYNMAKNTCDITNAIHNTTRDIIDNQNANSRSILDFLVKDKIETLQAENQSLRLAASQANQNAVLQAAMDANTAEIIRRTGNECPVPAYVVPNPNCCYNPFGFTYGNNGCGCA